MRAKVILEVDCDNTAAINYAYGQLLEALTKFKINRWVLKVKPDE